MSTSTPKTVNRVLWTVQIAAALLFLFAGSMKFIMPVEKMQQGPIIFSIAFMHFIGACECLGALGLVLPGVFRIQTWLTPLAAAAAIVPAIVGLATVWIAYGRTNVAPITDAPRRVLRAA